MPVLIAALSATILLSSVAALAGAGPGEARVPSMSPDDPNTIELPAPSTSGRMSLDEALAARRSVRAFKRAPLTEAQLSQLLWAAQGVTGRGGVRSAPSAGGLYPLELYVVMHEGCYHYEPRQHRLRLVTDGDLRRDLCDAALSQESITQAPAVFVLAAVFARTEAKYGNARSPRYIYMEVGHAAQNLLLEAVALGLGGVPIGAFDDAQVKRLLGLPQEHRPLYLIPVGVPR